MVEKIIASGPVVIENGRLLVSNDGKDDFYKIPGGKIHEGESLEETCLREFHEETGLKCKIIKKLSTMRLSKKPGTEESIKIELHHYLCKLIGKIKNYKPFIYDGHEIRWIKITDLSEKNYSVAPNIKFLFEKGEII